MAELTSSAMTETRRLIISGRVQGVGFRPFVYRLARRYSISGWVRNALGRVEIVVQGTVTEGVRIGPHYGGTAHRQATGRI